MTDKLEEKVRRANPNKCVWRIGYEVSFPTETIQQMKCSDCRGYGEDPNGFVCVEYIKAMRVFKYG